MYRYRLLYFLAIMACGRCQKRTRIFVRTRLSLTVWWGSDMEPMVWVVEESLTCLILSLVASSLRPTCTHDPYMHDPG